MSLHPGFKLLALQSRPDLAPADIYDANGLNGAALERLRVPPSILGAVWSDMTLAAVADLAALGHVTELGYEDLVGDPHRHLRRLADFIGVEADPAWLARASALIQERPPRWTVLDDAERQRLEEAVAPAMTRLGRTAVT